MVPRWSPRLQSHRASVAEARLSYSAWTNSDGRSIILMQRTIDSRRAAPRRVSAPSAGLLRAFQTERASSPLPQRRRSPPCRVLLSPRAGAHKSPARSCVKPANATAYCAPVSLPSRQTTRQTRDRTISAGRETRGMHARVFRKDVVFLAFPSSPLPLERGRIYPRRLMTLFAVRR